MEGQSTEETKTNGREHPSSTEGMGDDPYAPLITEEGARNVNLSPVHVDSLLPAEARDNLTTEADGIGLAAFSDDPYLSSTPTPGDSQQDDALEPLRLVGLGRLDGEDPGMDLLNFDADFADLLKAIGDENGQEAPEPGHSHTQGEGTMEVEIVNEDTGESSMVAGNELIVSDAEFDDAIAGLQIEDMLQDVEFTGDDSLSSGALLDEGEFLGIEDSESFSEDVAILTPEEYTDALEPLALDFDLSNALDSLTLGATDNDSRVDDQIVRGSSHPVESGLSPKNSDGNLTVPQLNSTETISPRSGLTPAEEEFALFNRLDDFLGESKLVDESGLDPLICGECAPIGHRVFPEDECNDDEDDKPVPPVVSGGSGRGKPASFVLNGQLQQTSVEIGAVSGSLDQITEEEEENENSSLLEATKKANDESQCQDANEEVDPFEAAIAADIAKQRIDLDELLKLSLLSLKDEHPDEISAPPHAKSVSSLEEASNKKSRAKNKLSRTDTNNDQKEKKADHDVRCGRQRSFRQKQSKQEGASNKMALDAAAPYTSSFGSTLTSDHGQLDAATESQVKHPKNERSCTGHCTTVFCVSFSPDGRFLASASQDSTVRIWNVRNNSLVATLTGHSKKHDCLRVAWAPGDQAKWLSGVEDTQGTILPLLASADTGGVVKVWRLSCEGDDDTKMQWESVGQIDHTSHNMEEAGIVADHSTLVGNKSDNCSGDDAKAKSIAGDEEESDEPPHIYVLQFAEGWQYNMESKSDEDNADPRKGMMLLTSSDDFIHLWEPSARDTTSGKDTALGSNKKGGMRMMEFKRSLAFRFGQLNEENGGVLIHSVAGLPGPHRNYLEGTTGVFVFDASYCQTNNLFGAALSDGSLRLINVRGVCVSILQLPGCSSNITSFTWDSTGTRLASSVATGHVVLWDVEIGEGKENGGCVGCSCRAVLEGGHDRGRPVFGVKYCGDQPQRLLMSWGSDGKLCLWDSSAIGQVGMPLSVLLSRQNASIFAVAENELATGTDVRESTVAVGGGSDVSSLGGPIQLFDIAQQASI